MQGLAPSSRHYLIPPPLKSIIRKWHIAVSGEDAHLIVMSHVTTELIDEFVEEMKMAR